MTGDTFFDTLLVIWMGLAVLTFGLLFKKTAPYGRHLARARGPMVSHRLGWIIMESVSPTAFAWFFLTGAQGKTAPAWLFLGLWLTHYANRSIVYPLRARTGGREMPVLIMVSAIFFNAVNGYLNGCYLGSLAPVYPTAWLWDPRFVLGAALFASGFAVNIQADRVLLKLREPGDSGYKIPHGSLYRYISCPNYLGEIMEWTGFAVMTWSLPAASFALWTAANLLPRAAAHHEWYRKTFADYPRTRKAIIPFLW